jgi:hypothetical protein
MSDPISEQPRGDGTDQPIVGGVVFLAWHFSGWMDDAPTLVAVCDSEATALRVNDEHKVRMSKDEPFRKNARWWVGQTKIVTSNKGSTST